ncbi:MAG TPA: PorV/PorQ family protein [Flavobacteriales bacterium]|nr:PorV/PorQ family protein [Flavobacteriales bacterium]HQX98577.1 PorV/PorQ family protein [Flavobacteriales bacterium]
MSKWRFFGVAMSLWVACAVHAQDAPKYSNEFLAVGVGARALGMGNAYTSVVNDVTSGYWNPAGILGVQGDLQVGLMHSEYFAGIAKYDYIGLAKPIDSASTIGFTFIRFGIDNIPNTIDLIDPSGNIDYDRITSFSSADHAFIITYARKMKVPGLRIGGNAKVIYRRVGSFGKAWGFGLDGGVQYDRDQWRFSAVARDVTSTFNAWSYTLDERTIEVFTQTENEIPVNSVEVTLPRLNLGVARQFKFGSKFDLIAAVDLENTFDGQRNTLIKSELVSTDPRVGLELGYAGVVYIRTGVSNMQYITDISDNKQLSVQPNIGLGLKIKSVSLDYALTDIGDNSVALYSNIFSLKFDLFKRPGS